MEGAYRFFRKYFISTILILLLFFVLNIILIFAVLLFAWSRSTAQNIPMQKLSDHIYMSDTGTINADDTAIQILEQEQAWSMLLDNNGAVIWQYHTPEEIPLQYTAADIAGFSRWYLEGYPTYVREHPEGLLVVGCVPGSVEKLSLSIDAQYISTIRTGIIFVITANLLLMFILFWKNTRKVEKEITPILQGIEQISKGQPVSLPDKGELAEIGSKLNKTGGYLIKKEQARAEWINGISHDVRTPLSYILGYAGEIEDNVSLPPMVREQAETIRRQGEKLRQLINDLNLTSKLEYSMQPLNREYLCPVELVRQVIVAYLEKKLDEKYSIGLQEGANVPNTIYGDASLLARMLGNLIGNSITHNPGGCHILITTVEENGQCVFTVADNGVGVSAEKLGQLNSEKFPGQSYQVNGEAAHGLGLRIVCQIAKAHGGTVTFESQNGFSVTIALPPAL